MNKIILIGRLTKDPELSTTSSGISLCRFTIAVDRPFKNSEGEREADFLPVVVWRQQAENCGKYLRKGRQCAVEGSVQTRSYDDKEGARRYVTEVVADRVQFLGDGGGRQDAPAGGDFDDTVKKMPAGKKRADNVKDLPPVEDDEDLPF